MLLFRTRYFINDKELFSQRYTVMPRIVP